MNSIKVFKIRQIFIALFFLLLLLSLASCDLLQLTPSGPTSVDALTMSRAVDDTYQPTDPTTSFDSSDSTIYAVAKVSNLPDGTKLSARWYYNGEEIPEVRGNLYISGKTSTGYVAFSIVPAVGEPFASGSWKVEVYLNDTLAKTASFTVQ